MGADYSAYSLLGVIFKTNSFYKKELVKIGNHSFPENFKFDTISGKPLWKTEETCILEDFEPGQDDKFNNLDVLYGTDGKYTYMGFKITDDTHSEGNYDNMFDVGKLNIEQVKRNCENALELYGFWNPKEFGLWTILYCSY